MTYETKDSGARVAQANGMVRDTSTGKVDYTLLLDGPLLRRWAELLARGAAKYGKRNWCKAFDAPPGDTREETRARFRESAMRHFFQWLEGDRTEDHAAAVLFNLNGYEALRDGDERRGAAVPVAITDDKGPTFDPLNRIIRSTCFPQGKVSYLVDAANRGCKVCETDLLAAGYDKHGNRAVPL